ncbi:MAG: hypothetical protein K940chlam7_01273 [Chlamydiae bacterium]|nr:hypothetical protein [Chlamydiota bacterium]
MINISKESLGKQLKTLLSSGRSIQYIACWASDLSLHYESFPSEIREILENLSFMEAGPEFQYTKEELYQLGNRLIEEGEKDELLEPIQEIKEKATELDKSWLMCPSCQEVWKSTSMYGMVRCPGCRNKLHNPRYLRSR